MEELVAGKRSGHLLDGEWAVVEVPELDPRRAIRAPTYWSASTATVPSRPSGRQHEADRKRSEWNAEHLAGILELGRHSWRMNLAAAVDLDGWHRERQRLDQIDQETSGL